MIAFFSQWFNFSLCFFLLFWKGWPPLKSLIRLRSSQMQHAMEEAQEAFEKAHILLSQSCLAKEGIEKEKNNIYTDCLVAYEMEQKRIQERTHRKIMGLKEHATLATHQLLLDCKNSLSQRFLEQVFAYADAALKEKQDKAKNSVAIAHVLEQSHQAFPQRMV